MRIMIKFTFPVDAGNNAIRSRKVQKALTRIPRMMLIFAPAAAIQI